MRAAALAVALASAVIAPPVLAAEPSVATTPAAKTPEKPGAKKKPKRKAPVFTLPSLGEVPKAEGVRRSTHDAAEAASRTSATAPKYEVIAVSHGKAFAPSANGAVPVGGAIEAVTLRGLPKHTEKFATVIRVRSAQRQGAEIEVAILDPRGSTALAASGTLSYRGARSDDAEWIVEWDPSPVRGAGAYQVLVRVAGQPLGTWPLAFVDE